MGWGMYTPFSFMLLQQMSSSTSSCIFYSSVILCLWPFSDSLIFLLSIMKIAAYSALLQNPASRTLHEHFFSIRATVQCKLCWMENNWWVAKAAQIQSYADVNDTKSFYEALKGIYRWTRLSLHPIGNIDGVLIKNMNMILARWAECLQNLLNNVHAIDPGFLDDLPTQLIIPKSDDSPSFGKVEKAVPGLKDY